MGQKRSTSTRVAAQKRVTGPETNLTGGEYGRASTTCPPLDNSLKLRETISQCGGAGLQDQRRFDLVHFLALHSRYSIEASPRYDALGLEFLAAPRADDQI